MSQGSIFALLGPNGAGKTTLVRILATLMAPDAGRAMVAGHDVVRQPREVRRAISLLGTPRVLFPDEPTTGLDPRSRNAVWELVRQQVREGVTVLLTTQYLEEADQLADRVAVIDRGKVVASGRPEELKALVPGGHIELTFSSPQAMAQAQRLLGEAKAGDLTLTLPADGSAAELKVLLDRLDGIDVATLTLSKPTLDDVFLTLTGK